MKQIEVTFSLFFWLSSVASAALTGSATLDSFSTLVVFGDSYTDDGPDYYTPTPDEELSSNTSTGGRIWTEYIQQYTGINLYDYAVDGAICEGVKDVQIPYFLNDTNYVGNGSLVDLGNETIYAIWIGTNDLGPSVFFTDGRPNQTIVDYVDCVYDQLDTLYEAGARNFVLLNIAPLNYAPMYALPEYGGTINPQYWQEESTWTNNITQVSEKMREYVALVNSIYQYRTPAELQILDRYPASSFTIYDVHSLMSDIWNNPESYLNGTLPLNVTSTVEVCGSVCSNSSARDSYMWADTLHPSEQTDRIIAQGFVDIVNGNSTWGQTWISSSA